MHFSLQRREPAKRGPRTWQRYAFEAGIVAVVAVLLIRYIDRPLALRLAQGNPAAASLHPLDALSHFGHGEYYLIIAAALLGAGSWLVRRQAWHRSGQALLQTGSLIAGTLAIGHLLVFVLKQMVARLRPAELINGDAYGFAAPFSGEPFTSLPSSHGFTVFAMAAVLSRLQPGLRAFFFGTAILVALQRMLAQQHFLSDIFISLFLALMVSEAMHAAWQSGTAALARRLLSPYRGC